MRRVLASIFAISAHILRNALAEKFLDNVPPFVCVDGSKIPLKNVCDGFPHCPDSSDELRKLCHHVVCPLSLYRCAYGACVPRSSRCNGIQDCTDGSDEFHCEIPEVCSEREFQCSNSTECIPLADLCNGYPDCKDISDENETVCKEYPCASHTYHCAYGGCVHQEVICDGVKDCVDGSDEEPGSCAAINCKGKECEQYQCRKDEFHCENSGQCIPGNRVCDGSYQCRDGSDEDSSFCESRECPPGSFRCAYGGCIDQELTCNLEPNCHDWSDEDEAMCGRSLPEGACRLPSAKPGTHYNVSDCPKCRPGDVVPELARLDYFCELKGSLEGAESVYCHDNKWLPAIPTCPSGVERITCPPVFAPGARKRCEAMWGPHQGWVDCNKSVSVGTRVTMECPDFYERDSGSSRTTCLHDGTWSQGPLKCIPTCGRRDTPASTLIVKGWETSREDALPWHATLFSHDDGKWTFFCGGTLIGERVVLTAGHCIWQTASETVRVSLGTYSSNFSLKDENVQVFDLERIELQDSYQDHEGNYGSDLAILILERPAVLNSYVRPACIDWANTVDISQRSGEVGLVNGMGITEKDTSSPTLRATSLEVVSDEKCRGSQKEDFRKYLTYTTFCAGWGNGTGVCNGDSGGSFVLRKPNSTVWEVQGVVSISPRRVDSVYCDPNFYTVFTKVSMYTNWIRNILNSIPVIGPPDNQQSPNRDVIL